MNLANLIETEYLRAAETEAGRKQMRERLRRILRERLVHADVFAGAKSDQIWNLSRVSPHPCPQRSQLVDMCVEALLAYSRFVAKLLLACPDIHRDVEDALQLIGNVLAAFYPKGKRIRGLYEELAERVRAIRPEKYASLGRNRLRHQEEAKADLSHSLCVAFLAHLPHEPYYPNSAIFDAVASILQIFEIDTGARSIVGDRVRKRFEAKNVGTL